MDLQTRQKFSRFNLKAFKWYERNENIVYVKNNRDLTKYVGMLVIICYKPCLKLHVKQKKEYLCYHTKIICLIDNWLKFEYVLAIVLPSLHMYFS